MTYLLDTNTCIRLLNNSSDKVITRLANEEPRNIYLCTVVQFELIFGAYRSNRTEENLATLSRFFSQFDILPFDEKAASLCGKIRAELIALGTPIGPYDLQIAAIAR
ncbi:MAG: type II toxin-antitoxin system VapC family toxin, partial [Cyanobacteriota bacterium]|nr:type II toxin-antitoxin system VapC family toxin [Cyanobacteriota bacterium]